MCFSAPHATPCSRGDESVMHRDGGATRALHLAIRRNYANSKLLCKMTSSIFSPECEFSWPGFSFLYRAMYTPDLGLDAHGFKLSFEDGENGLHFYIPPPTKKAWGIVFSSFAGTNRSPKHVKEARMKEREEGRSGPKASTELHS